MARKKRDDEELEQPELPDEEEEEKKPTRKEKIAYEKELVKEGKILPRYSPRSPFGRILLLILVFFFGLFAAIGGIIGTFAYLGTRPVKDGFKLFNLEYDKYITESAANKSVLDIVKEAGDLNNFNSLGAVSEYTPLVDTLFKGIDEQLSKIGVHIDEDELKATPFSEIGAYFSESVIQNIVLGEVLSLKPDGNPLLLALCYGEEGVDYEIVTADDGTRSFKMLEGHSPLTIKDVVDSEDMSALLNKITVEAALNITADSPAAMRYLAYGSFGTHYEIRTEGETKTIVMLNDGEGNPYPKKSISSLTEANADLLNNAKISDLIDTTGAESVLGAIKDWTINDLGNTDKFMDLKMGDLLGDEEVGGIVQTIVEREWTFRELAQEDVLNELKISEIFEIGEGGGILGAVRDWTLDDLADTYRIERLKISQFISTGDDPLMRKIGEWRLGEMGNDKFNTLTLADVLDLGENPPKLLETLKDFPLSDCASAIDEMRLCDILEGDLSGNMILKNLQNCTLNDLADKIQALTVADLFGDEVYAYMRIGDDNGTPITYASVVQAYETEHKVKETSACKINELFIDWDELNNNSDGKTYSAQSYYVLKSNGNEVTFGTFERTDGGYSLLTGGQRVYNSESGLYIERELRLTPFSLWKTVDYANKTLVPLNAGAFVSDSYGDRTNGSPEGSSGTAYMQNGAPMYYIEGDKYYPMYEDAYSFYIFNAAGARVDFDSSVSGYTTPDGTELTLAEGKVTYLGNVYSVRNNADGAYIMQKITVEQFYYAENGAGNGIYAESELFRMTDAEEHWRLVSTLNGVTTNEGELDRFLDGVWYLLFGGEERDSDDNFVLDANGKITVLDKTNTPLTEVAESITGMNDVLNATPLWQLYLHGIIPSNPFAEFMGQQINELTIEKLIQLITSMSA